MGSLSTYWIRKWCTITMHIRSSFVPFHTHHHFSSYPTNPVLITTFILYIPILIPSTIPYTHFSL